MERDALQKEADQLHAEICAALADPRRIVALYVLAEKPRTVNELAADLGITQSAASRHLKVLREKGLVQAERQGTSVEYRLCDQRLIEALDLLRSVLRDDLAHRASLMTTPSSTTPTPRKKKGDQTLKTLLILGAGTAGTSLANKLVKKLDAQEWKIIVVDRDENHYYQPGFLFVPFGMYQPDGVVKPKKNFISRPIELIFSDIEVIEPEASQVRLVKDKQVIHYDYLVVATGCDIAPEETPGLKDAGWRKNIFDFYTYEGSVALAPLPQLLEGRPAGGATSPRCPSNARWRRWSSSSWPTGSSTSAACATRWS